MYTKQADKSENSLQYSKKGFTMLELLVVIGILTVLALAIILILNPFEFYAQSRDTRRLSEIKAINDAINHYNLSTTPSSEPNKVYISIPSDYPNCSDLSLPPLQDPDKEYVCAAPTTFRKTDKTGWIPLDFTGLPVSFGALPVDPVNSAGQGLYYTYISSGGKWEITTNIESDKYGPSGSGDVVTTDGGDGDTRYEDGSDLTLTPNEIDGSTGGGAPPAPSAPTATTDSVTVITSTTATLYGSAIANYATTTGWFRYSTTQPTSCTDDTDIWNSTRTPNTLIGSGGSSRPYSQTINVTSGTIYYFCAIASNDIGIAYGSVLDFEANPLVTTTLGGGEEGISQTIAPGYESALDAFTFQTNTEVETINSITVSLSNTNGVGSVLIKSSDGFSTTYGSSSSVSAVMNIPLTTNITATTTQTQYRVWISSKNPAQMPDPPGGNYVITATVTGWSGTTTNHVGSDTNSATVTIDNLSPGNATDPSVVASNEEATISWRNPTDTDIAKIIVLRKLSPFTSADNPVEGTDYNDGSTIVGSTIVACVSIVSSPSTIASCTDTGLSPQNYYFKVFVRDIHMNYSVGINTNPQSATPESARYWVHGASCDGKWSNQNCWSKTSGGPIGASLPLSYTKAIFDSNSFTGNGQIVNINQNISVNTMDWTGTTDNPGLSGTNSIEIGRSLLLTNNMAITYSGPITFKNSNSVGTIKSAGNTLKSNITFDAINTGDPGGTWTLEDPLVLSPGSINLKRGTLDLNGKSLTAPAFSSTYLSGSRTLQLTGNSVMTLTASGGVWNVYDASTGLTISPGNSTIVLSGQNPQFSSSGQTYHNLTYTGNTSLNLASANNNTFNDVEIIGAGNASLGNNNVFNNLTIGSNMNQVTFNQTNPNGLAKNNVNGLFSATGTSSRKILFRSSSAGSVFKIDAGSTNLSYIDVKDSDAGGTGSPFICSNCENSGNNFDWTFTTNP